MRPFRHACFAACLALSLQGVGHAQDTRNLAVGATQTTPASQAPPVGVSDILDVLARYRPDPEQMAQYQRETSEPLPDASNKKALAIYYHRRGLAHGRLGRARQQIADLWQAHAYGWKSGSDRVLGDINQIRTDLALAEVLGGNIRHSIQLARLIVDGNSSRSTDDDPYNVYWHFVGRAIEVICQTKLFDLNASKAAIKALDEAYWSLRNNIYIQAVSLGPLDSIADILHKNSHALMLDLEGRYADAEPRHRRAAALANSLADLANSALAKRFADPAMVDKATFYVAIMDDFLANNLRYQGRNVEAEAHARAGLLRTLAGYGRNSHYTALNLYSLGRILFESGRFADAAALARASIDSFAQAGASVQSANLAEARILLGDALLAQERWAEAAAVYAERDQALRSDAQQYAIWSGENIGWGYALLRSNQIAPALAMIERVYRQRLSWGHAQTEINTAQARGFYAMVLAAHGRTPEAFAEFQGAIPALLDHARQSGGGSVTRQQHLAAILEAWMNLLVDLKDSPLLQTANIDAANETFRIADIARGSAVQRALAASAARATPADPALAALARKEQDAGQRYDSLSELLNHLLAAPPGQQLTQVIRDVRRDLDALREQRATLKQELEQRFPDYAELIAAKPVSIAQIQAALSDGEAMVALYVGAERSLAWAIPKQGAPAFASVALTQADAAQRVAHLRQALDVGAVELERFPPFDLAQAHDLYRRLFQPIAAGWMGAKRLVVVPHKALAELPFAVLVTTPPDAKQARGKLFADYRRAPWLIRNVALTQLPSASTLLSLRRVPPAASGRREFIGFGDPWFSRRMADDAARASGSPALAAATRGVGPIRRAGILRAANSATLANLARLEDTIEEITGIANTLKADRSSDVFLGKAASEKNVLSGKLDNRRVIVFATHGLLPGDLNGLTQPALALSAPEVTGNANEDGLLTMQEVLGLKLNADWVVLSACNTAAGAGAGSEAVSGLGKAFFFAGTRALLVSNWPVETVSARLLTTHLFAHQAAHPDASRAESLRATLLDLIDRAETDDFSYAHPMFWAPFSLVGDGR